MSRPTFATLLALLSLTVLVLAATPAAAGPLAATPLLLAAQPQEPDAPPPTRSPRADVERILKQVLPKFGHRNWIVVADSAYPSQARQGITTVYLGGDQLAAVRAVLAAADAARHVQPIIHVDAELKHVPEADAPGIEAYRRDLAKLLGDRQRHTEPHEEIIEKLDAAAETFHVLIFKTDMTLPYTSVFLELDCGYWGAEKEARLKEARLRAAIERVEK
jgi:hypothetical protein